MKKSNTNRLSKLKKPIKYFSDLFIGAMVAMWITDCIYESIIATTVTVSSIILSHRTGMQCYDTSMWASIGTNVAIPLSCGGAIWMIKNSLQHAISNYKGKDATPDFQETDIDCMDETLDEQIEQLDVLETDDGGNQ